MPFPNVSVLESSELCLGDILIQSRFGYNNLRQVRPYLDHSMLWLGGVKPLAHSQNSRTGGILAQSIEGGVAKARKYQDETNPIVGVYRSTNILLTSKAVEFGRKFAVFSNDLRFVLAKALINDGKIKKCDLSSRFPFELYGGSYFSSWNEKAMVRAVRAYYHATACAKALAADGVSCSQFITYTYQAASIAILISHHAQTRVVIQSVIDSGVLDDLDVKDAQLSKQRYSAAIRALKSVKNTIDETMHPVFKIDTDYISIVQLHRMLNQTHACTHNFSHVGNLQSNY